MKLWWQRDEKQLIAREYCILYCNRRYRAIREKQKILRVRHEKAEQRKK